MRLRVATTLGVLVALAVVLALAVPGISARTWLPQDPSPSVIDAVVAAPVSTAPQIGNYRYDADLAVEVRAVAAARTTSRDLAVAGFAGPRISVRYRYDSPPQLARTIARRTGKDLPHER